ncbi:hypothetical protein BDZ89DRAFT_1070775 [Hymenopellis radicata]|nr:hypothetical protein BDZ89DRAFT_1070775 [Hymenopellis radicata]
MAHSPQAPHGNVSSGPRLALNSLLFMGAVALGFAGFYYAIDRRDRLRRESGQLAAHERALLRAKEDHGGHRLYASDAPAITVPSPQRSKGDGSGLAYTNYGKTKTHRDDPYGLEKTQE